METINLDTVRKYRAETVECMRDVERWREIARTRFVEGVATGAGVMLILVVWLT